MIEFNFSLSELNELKESVPNFHVILDALQSNPMIKLVIDEEN